MKLKEVFLYELRYQLRSITPHLFFLVFLAISYLIVVGNYVPDAILLEFYINSPFVIASVTIVTTMFWLLIAPAIAGEAAARDIHTRMYSLVYTSPVSKASYIGGKFLAALLINSLIMLSIPLGIILGTYTSGLEDSLIGPFRMSGYLTAFFYISFPNIFLATALQFLFSVVSGRAVASYLAGFAVYSGSYLIAFTLGNQEISNLLDPMSHNYIISTIQRSWTPLDLNNRLLTLDGLFLINRLLWMGVGIGLLIIAYSRFKFSYPGSSRKEKKKYKIAAAQKPQTGIVGLDHAVTAPIVPQSFALDAKLAQTFAIASSSLSDILKRKGGFISLLVVALFSLLVVYSNMDHLGIPLVADTWRVLLQLAAPLGSVKIPWIFMVILIAFYAGELIWREREAGIHDVYDATPIADWVLFTGKFLALAAFIIIFAVLLIAVGVSAQLLLGNDTINLLLYLKILFGMQLVDYLLFALLACFVHILVNQKYIGHFVVLLAFAYVAFAPILGIENKLLIFGSDSGWSYTDMQGFSELKLWLVYKLYWIGLTILLALMARLLWVRGRDYHFNNRYKVAAGRISRAGTITSLAAIALMLVSGGFVWYNTRIVNTYYTQEEVKAYKAEYEKRYRRFRNVPQPKLLMSDLKVDLYPEQRKMNIAGSYQLVNQHSVPVDTLHLYEAVEVAQIAFDRPAELVLHDKKFGHRIYKLAQPVQPGDSLRMEFQLSYRNDVLSGKNTANYVADNGTSFKNYQVLPAIGYQFLLELKEKSEREAYKLKPRPEWASLDDVEARSKLLMWDHKIMVESVVSTNADQLAVGPGMLQDSWSEGNRKYFKYATNAPIGEFSFFSADYALYKDQWKDVSIQVYHHPKDTLNLDRMVAGMKKSLEYYSERFGPYPYDLLRLVELSSTEFGLHASPTNIDYYEGFAYMNPAADERDLDFVFAVLAHEVAHQWWGNQLRYARVEGGGILSESLAWYSAMKVVEEVFGEQTIRELLDLLQKEYDLPKSRADVPLIKGNDWFHLYRKGPLALYAISEYIGDDRMEEALRHLFKKHGKGQPPLPTSIDLYKEIEAVTPDSLHYLLHDLFIENTFWDLEIVEATAEKTSKSDWEVRLKVEAQKLVVDSTGAEKEVPMNDWLEVGIYEEGKGLDEPLYLRMHRIRSGEQTITVRVPRKPELGGIDPNHLMIDLRREDNIIQLQGE